MVKFFGNSLGTLKSVLDSYIIYYLWLQTTCLPCCNVQEEMTLFFNSIVSKTPNVTIVGPPSRNFPKRVGEGGGRSDFSHTKGGVGKIGGAVNLKIGVYHLFSYQLTLSIVIFF